MSIMHGIARHSDILHFLVLVGSGLVLLLEFCIDASFYCPFFFSDEEEGCLGEPRMANVPQLRCGGNKVVVVYSRDGRDLPDGV